MKPLAHRTKSRQLSSSQGWGLPGRVQAEAGSLLSVSGGVWFKGQVHSHSGEKVESDGLRMALPAALVSATTALLGPLDRGSSVRHPSQGWNL